MQVLILFLKPFVRAELFSSPEHKVLKLSFCDRFLSVVRACVRPSVRASVNFPLKRHLLNNHWANFNETSQEYSLGEALPKLLKSFLSVAEYGREAPKRVFKVNFSKNLLLQNHKAQSLDI